MNASWRKIPWWAVTISVVVLVTAAVAVEPIRDAATLETVGEVRLTQPAAYLATAPPSNVLDTLTLLTVAQHIALFVWIVAVTVVLRALAARRRATTIAREVRASLLVLGVIVLTYVVGALVPRPMAQLVPADGLIVSIDFHSHTKYSHDGRRGWGPDDVRDWHRGAGFDAAYVTDHRTYRGAEEGIAGNPRNAGEGTMLLQGIEVILRGQHVNILDAGRRYGGLTSPDLRDVDEQALMLTSLMAGAEPVVVQTIPDDLSKIPAAGGPGTPGVRAIEIVDGAPRGLAQGRRDRARIVHLADSLNLALVAGSDNHGWGRAAPGWTLMRIGGWRGMGTDSLERAIESIMRAGRRTSTRVVERRVAGAETPVDLALTGVAVSWRMFTTLSTDERVVWIIWIWGLVAIARTRRFIRLRPSRAA
jgi:hypothetical protein